jgi:GNAT superfamily N-acetyltransferase
MTPVQLRSASPADSEFCFQLHKAAMGGYITTIWGWDEQVQRGFHDRAFNPGRWRIITAGGVDIGMIDVEYRPAEIYLARIEVHPTYQGHGIGTRLVSALIDEAARKGQDLVLDVLTVNHRAQALYQGLGMTEVARHGDGNIKITMRSSQPRQTEPMGKQYHFWPGEGGMDAWDVDRLIARVAHLPVEEIALEDLPEIDSEYWFDERERPTVRKVIAHFRLVGEVDPSYPIILGPGNRVMDGMHRVARALLDGHRTIKAKRLPELPEPDYRGCRPDELPY